MKHKFYRENNRWYIDLPNWKGTKSDLLMVAGADKLLERLSNGQPSVSLEVDTEPFDGSMVMTRLMKTPFIGGATYKTNNGRLLWLCKVTEFVFGSMPKHIYYKPLAEA